jgi:hypothetical protein
LEVPLRQVLQLLSASSLQLQVTGFPLPPVREIVAVPLPSKFVVSLLMVSAVTGAWQHFGFEV